jgi:hypothetical protein
MLDKQKEQGDKQESAKANAAPELQRGAVIGDTSNQARWNRAQKAHYLDQDQSATELFRENGDAPVGTCKFGIDGLGDDVPVEVAYKFPEIKLGLDQKTKDSLSAFIYRGKEDEQMDYKACAAAYKAFPEFARHPEVDKTLLPAIIRNELHFYSLWKDSTADGLAGTLGGIPNRPETSLGVAQIQQRHLPRLMKEFPQLREKAEITDPVKAVLDKHMVPWLVAAYLADGIRTLEAQKKPVTNRALMLLYNPGGKEHIDNVSAQMKLIQARRHEI